MGSACIDCEQHQRLVLIYDPLPPLPATDLPLRGALNYDLRSSTRCIPDVSGILPVVFPAA